MVRFQVGAPVNAEVPAPRFRAARRDAGLWCRRRRAAHQECPARQTFLSGTGCRRHGSDLGDNSDATGSAIQKESAPSLCSSRASRSIKSVTRRSTARQNFRYAGAPCAHILQRRRCAGRHCQGAKSIRRPGARCLFRQPSPQHFQLSLCRCAVQRGRHATESLRPLLPTRKGFSATAVTTPACRDRNPRSTAMLTLSQRGKAKMARHPVNRVNRAPVKPIQLVDKLLHMNFSSTVRNLLIFSISPAAPACQAPNKEKAVDKGAEKDYH